tara:strand:+ start:277 stop:453 length:177 start_codon:yes stop_codon:yes gene_type:complete
MFFNQLLLVLRSIPVYGLRCPNYMAIPEGFVYPLAGKVSGQHRYLTESLKKAKRDESA